MNEMAVRSNKMGIIFALILAASAVVLGTMTTIF